MPSVNKRRTLWVAGFILILAAIVGTAGPPAPASAAPGTFSFAALGDAPYFLWEDLRYRLVLQDLRAHDLRLVLHVGDVFWRPCSDARFERSLDGFNGLPQPVIYTPGDNEWADCWERQSGDFAPLERLARLRQLFYPAPVSLGGRREPLQTQASQSEFTEFVEHLRWTGDGLVFATLHLVGSGNATDEFPKRTPQDDEEVTRRTAAATAWLRDTFAAARAAGAPAVILGFHANPAFERPPDYGYRQHYEPFLTALEEEVAAFGKPVLAIHGDNHIYTVDHPLVRRTTGRRLENLTRLQVPGSPDVGWVRIVVTPGPTPTFTFEPRVVPRWKYW